MESCIAGSLCVKIPRLFRRGSGRSGVLSDKRVWRPRPFSTENPKEYQGTIIFGAFTTNEWKDELSYYGDEHSYLFSLAPKYTCYRTKHEEQNFQYMNSKKVQNSRYKVGVGKEIRNSFIILGFGGKNYDNYRIWIDEAIESSSYCNPSDDTYETGYLLDPSIRKLRVYGID